MLFNGAGIAEHVDLSANGSRLKFFRLEGNITMDTAGVERVDFIALGGADVVTVNDLAGTDVETVNTNLAASIGGNAGDGQNDQVIVNGTNGNDKIDVGGDAAGVAVTGLAALVAIQHQEPSDKLDVKAWGNDAISAAELAAQAITLTLDGGAGDDTIAGAKGVEAPSAATATTRSTGTGATTSATSARATTRSSGIRATAATPSRARTAPTRCCSTEPTAASRSTCRRTVSVCASSAPRARSRWIRTSVETVDFQRARWL